MYQTLKNNLFKRVVLSDPFNVLYIFSIQVSFFTTDLSEFHLLHLSDCEWINLTLFALGSCRANKVWHALAQSKSQIIITWRSKSHLQQLLTFWTEKWTVEKKKANSNKKRFQLKMLLGKLLNLRWNVLYIFFVENATKKHFFVSFLEHKINGAKYFVVLCNFKLCKKYCLLGLFLHKKINQCKIQTLSNSKSFLSSNEPCWYLSKKVKNDSIIYIINFKLWLSMHILFYLLSLTVQFKLFGNFGDFRILHLAVKVSPQGEGL